MEVTDSKVWNEKHLKRLKDARACIDENKESISCKYLLRVNETFNERLDVTEAEEMPRILELDDDSFYEEVPKGPKYQPTLIGGAKVKQEGNLITMNEFFESYPGRMATPTCQPKRGMRVALTGPAGSGKTKILGWFAREATKGNIHQMNREDFLVHQVNCKELNPNEEITVPEFLFKTMLCEQLLSEEDMKITCRWMLENSDKAGLIIDSLDTMRFRLEGAAQVIGPDDSAIPDVILCNLLAGNIFRESFVLISSQEYKIKGCKGALRPDKVMSLAGLTKASIRNLTIGFLGSEEGERVLRKLEEYPGLREVCEAPVFLIFTIIGFKRKEDASAFVPKSITGVLVNLVNCLFRGKHAHTRKRLSEEEFISAINKMKDLAYNGMMDDRSLYNEEDLEDAKLSAEEILNLALIVPGEVEEILQLLETGAVSFFIHQTVGELFCALKICEMELEGFYLFVSKHLHDQKYSAIRLLICGVLLDDEVFEEASKLMLRGECDYEEKRKMLRESLKDRYHELLQDKDGRRDLLQLFHAISELKDGRMEITPPSIDEVDMFMVQLMPSDMFALGGSIYCSSHLNKLALCHCNLSSESVQALFTSLQHSDLKVTELNVSSNEDMGMKGLFSVGRLVARHGVYKLGIAECKLKSDDVDSLDEGLGDSKVTELDVSSNYFLGAKGLFAVGRLVGRHGVDKLEMRSCSQEPEEVDSFNEGLGDSKVMVIDMRLPSDSLDSPLPTTAICNLLSNITEYLDLRGNMLTEEDESLLQKKLNQLHPTTLKVVVGGALTGRQEKILLSEANRDPVYYMVAEKQFSMVVETSGKEIRVHECIINFAKGSFSKAETVEGRLEIDKSKWPPGYLVITPMIYLRASGNLQTPATIRASSWCTNDGSSDGQSVTAHVLHRRNGSSTWDVLETLPLTHEKFFNFDYMDFSPVCVGLEIDSLGSQMFKVEVSLFATMDNIFTTAFCIGDEMVMQCLREIMSQIGFNIVEQFNSIDAKVGDRLKACVSCMKAPSFAFTPVGDFAFVFDESFLTMHMQRVQKSILNHDQSSVPSRRVALKFETYKNDALVDGPHGFCYIFKVGSEPNAAERTKLQTAVSPYATTFHAECRADTLVQGAHTYLVPKSNSAEGTKLQAPSSPHATTFHGERRTDRVIRGGVHASNYFPGSVPKLRKESVSRVVRKKLTSIRRRFSMRKKSKRAATPGHRGAVSRIEESTPPPPPPRKHLKHGEIEVPSEARIQDEEADEGVLETDDPEKQLASLRPRERRDQWTHDLSGLVPSLPQISSFPQENDAEDK